METEAQITTLEQLLERIQQATVDQQQVSLGEIMDSVGRRSFGPLLLVPGLVTLAPILGDIPGVPTLMALVVLLAAGQLLLQRDSLWLPHWMARRCMTTAKLRKALAWLQRPARWIDRPLRPRLLALVQGAGLYAVALACVLIALAMPVMEIVPFTANGAGAALTAFGLALVARDGVLALLALLVTLGTLGMVIVALL